jgi:hypothetical protein
MFTIAESIALLAKVIAREVVKEMKKDENK